MAGPNAERALPWGYAAAGIVFVSVAGSAAHSVYEWTGRATIVAPLVPINESVWEHLKKAFWPTLLWVAALRLTGRGCNHASAALTASLLAMCSIVGLNVVHELLVEPRSLAIDILNFIASVALGQLVAMRPLRAHERDARTRRLALAGNLLLVAAFVAATFFPPAWALFEE